VAIGARSHEGVASPRGGSEVHLVELVLAKAKVLLVLPELGDGLAASG
jgi:hypothetical protein